MTEAMLLAHGFTVDMLVDLIRAGLATANTERMVAGGRSIEVTRVRITDAGQRTHEDRTPTHGYAETRGRDGRLCKVMAAGVRCEST
jgi:hypothetical protein